MATHQEPRVDTGIPVSFAERCNPVIIRPTNPTSNQALTLPCPDAALATTALHRP